MYSPPTWVTATRLITILLMYGREVEGKRHVSLLALVVLPSNRPRFLVNAVETKYQSEPFDPNLSERYLNHDVMSSITVHVAVIVTVSDGKLLTKIHSL